MVEAPPDLQECCCCAATLVLCVQGYGVSSLHMDLVLTALWQHFRRRQRWEAARDFFNELVQVYSPAALALGKLVHEHSRSPPGHKMAYLSGLLARPVGDRKPPPVPEKAVPPHSSHTLVPSTMVGLGHELLYQGESEAAASLARRALAASPRCRPAWLLLAKCFVIDKQYAAALVALNVVPTPPLPAAEAELLHVVPPPAPKDTTKPQVRALSRRLSLRCCLLRMHAPGASLLHKSAAVLSSRAH